MTSYLRRLIDIARQSWRLRHTAPVEDDFPEVMHDWGGAVDALHGSDLFNQKPSPEIPTIVCLCGSTRFWRTFQDASLRETLAGKIVLSIGAARAADDDDKTFGGFIPVTEFDAQKIALDELHKRKIDLADEVLVLNVGGYIGESTRSEMEYALSLGRPVRFLEEAQR